MPSSSFIAIYVACLLPAAIIGYSIHKGSTCAVGAVAEMVHKQRFRRFMSFLLCSAIVAMILVPAAWMQGNGTILLPAYAPSWTSFAGGALFGLGAVLNGACNFGTINKLGSGDTRYLFLFPGLFAGATLGNRLPIEPPLQTMSALSQPAPIAIAWLALCLVLIVGFTITSIRHKRDRGTPGQPVAFYMAIIGGLTALITIALGPWHYTRIAVIGTSDWMAATISKIAILSGLASAVIAGAIFAAFRAGRFKFQPPSATGTMATFTGGMLMGLAILLVPGGNDGIILSGIPSLSVSAVVAYAAMCTTITLLVWIPRQLNPIPAAS